MTQCSKNCTPTKTRCELTKMAAPWAIEQNILPWGGSCCTAAVKALASSHCNSPLEGPQFGAWESSYNMRVLVDVMEVQGQDVVLAADIHAVMVLVHPQDPVVGRVEDVGEVMSGAGGSQLCLETEIRPLMTAVVHMHIFTHTHTHACTTDTFLVPLLHTLVELSDGFPPTLL